MKRKGSLSGRTLCKKAATVVMCAVLMLTTGIQTVKASTLDQQIEEAQSGLEQVKKDQSEVMTVYDQGSIGFVDWMLAKSNLTTKQKYDLNRAKTVLQEACEEVKMVVEGVYSAKAAKELAEKYDVEMPIITEINKVLFEGKSAAEAVIDLMVRDKKVETPMLPWEDGQ